MKLVINSVFDFLRPLLNLPPIYRFDSAVSTITVPVTLVNDDNISINTTMALDTGASFVVIRPGLITHLGLRFNPNQTVEVASASGLQAAPSIILPEVRTLSQTQYQVNAVIVDIPESSKIDGLLGLSFLNYYLLNIDFPGGKLTLGR